MNILVAEDDRMSREMLTRMIASDETYKVTAAADGEEAWKILCEGKQHFDVGIFDINMPRIDGFQLLERIRAMPSLRGLKAMLCTAAADRTTVERSRNLAVSHYIVKPYNKVVILAKLKSLREELGRLGAESREDVLNRLGMDAEIYAVLAKALLGEVTAWVATARCTSEAAKFSQIAKRIKGLRGACATFGLGSLVVRLEEVNRTLPNDSSVSQGQDPSLLLTQVMPILEQLDEELKRVKRHLEISD